MSGPSSLRDLCATAPLAIRQPRAGTRLHAICEKADKEPWWPEDFEGLVEMARKIVDRLPRPVDLPPYYREAAYVRDVDGCTADLLRLRKDQLADRESPDRYEGFAMFFTVYVFLVCGGRFGEDDHTEAHEHAAEYLGVTPRDVAGAVATYTAAACQLMLDDAHLKLGGQPAELLSAALRVMADMFVRYHNLLDHSHADARRAAEEAAEFDRRYQPCVEDIEYARS